MFIEESIWIKKFLKDLNPPHIDEVLDVGSSNLQFRTQTQPYIDENIFRPLRDNGCLISHLDKKNSEGVDFVFDVENMSVREIGKKFDLVICCSLLEHVREPEKVCSLLIDLTKKGGFLLVTVPRSYRYHLDPIDTMFRPSMKELISLFPGMEIIKKEVVYIKEKKRYNLLKISELLRYLIPTLNWKVNCLLMRKNK